MARQYGSQCRKLKLFVQQVVNGRDWQVVAAGIVWHLKEGRPDRSKPAGLVNLFMSWKFSIFLPFFLRYAALQQIADQYSGGCRDIPHRSLSRGSDGSDVSVQHSFATAFRACDLYCSGSCGLPLHCQAPANSHVSKNLQGMQSLADRQTAAFEYRSETMLSMILNIETAQVRMHVSLCGTSWHCILWRTSIYKRLR